MANSILGQTEVLILVMIKKLKRVNILKYQVNYKYNIIKGWTIIFKT